MTKDPQKVKFIQAKKDVVDNLEAIQMVLEKCVNDGMLDPEAYFYNEILDLIDETDLAKTNPELAEIITKAKTIEVDIDAWLASRGINTFSLQWPSAES